MGYCVWKQSQINQEECILVEYLFFVFGEFVDECVLFFDYVVEYEVSDKGGYKIVVINYVCGEIGVFCYGQCVDVFNFGGCYFLLFGCQKQYIVDFVDNVVYQWIKNQLFGFEQDLVGGVLMYYFCCQIGKQQDYWKC